VPLTPEQNTAARQAIGKHLKSCPICHTTSFLLGRDVTFLPRIEKGNFIDLFTGQPCVSAVCRTCGYLALFNVFNLGLAEIFNLKPSEVKEEHTSETATPEAGPTNG
jgi:hypothetical protein